MKECLIVVMTGSYALLLVHEFLCLSTGVEDLACE